MLTGRRDEGNFTATATAMDKLGGNMNIQLIRTHLKKCSDGMNEATNNATISQNQKMQDFLIWLSGYMDGMEHHEHSAIKVMVDTLNKKNEEI